MTRIIGGSAGGRRLRTPEGEGTRPTSDRVREALFSAVESALGSWHGLRVLDLYAGSGAVGLEARSRGAEKVTLVEADRRAASVIGENLRTLGLTAVDVVATSVERAVAGSPRTPYDVVFADPPYDVAAEPLEAVLAALVEHGWLADEALVVVERRTRRSEFVWPAGLEGTRSKKYGETTLWYGRATGT